MYAKNILYIVNKKYLDENFKYSINKNVENLYNIEEYSTIIVIQEEIFTIIRTKTAFTISTKIPSITEIFK